MRRAFRSGGGKEARRATGPDEGSAAGMNGCTPRQRVVPERKLAGAADGAWKPINQIQS